MFSTLWKTDLTFGLVFAVSSAIDFTWDKAKILSSGYELGELDILIDWSVVS